MDTVLGTMWVQVQGYNISHKLMWANMDIGYGVRYGYVGQNGVSVHPSLKPQT